MDCSGFPNTCGGKNVSNPIARLASRVDTLGNEVNPMHRLRVRKDAQATEAQATATVQGVEEVAKSEWPSVMGGIEVQDLPHCESRPTCYRCNGAKPLRTFKTTHGVLSPSWAALRLGLPNRRKYGKHHNHKRQRL